MKIYTKTGDSGETSLFDGTRVAKNHPRVAAYGDVDEVQAALGVALAAKLDPDLADMAIALQRDLFALGARLADPSHRIAPRVSKIVIDEASVARLEGWIDRLHAATEGIRLDLKLDAYPVSINVAMPTGLVVNELLTNAFKHAFVGRSGGTIRLQSVVDGDGCRVIVADDGVGLPAGITWPKPGKLGALIAQSLRENAKAEMMVASSPGTGTSVTIVFRRSIATSA